MENIKQKERACVYCGQMFVSNNARKKLCSVECVNKYRKEYAKRRFAKPEIKARVMELDPKYCDVIRRRYTKWALQNNKPLTSGCLE